MANRFLERLTTQKKPLLGDGAMGTLLHARGLSMDSCFEGLNLRNPSVITQVHQDYLRAGAEIIETNTFAANRLKLAEFDLQDQLVEINQAGIRIAQEAVQALRDAGEITHEVYIAAAVGPLGAGLQPFGRMKLEDAEAIFREQISALMNENPDMLWFETFNDPVELELAIKVARSLNADFPLVCHMTFAQDDRTLTGFLPGRVAQMLKEAGATVIGANCSGGPAQLARILLAMKRAVPQILFSVMPNAGFPEMVNGRTMYPATIEYFGDYAVTFQALGANIIGGCCGTTPEHIASMRTAIDDPSRRPTREIARILPAEPSEDEEYPVEVAERPSQLAHHLHNGDFVVTVELKPPRSHNFDRILEAAELLRNAGSTVLNVADSPTARMRVSPWAVCHSIENQLGIETILHFPTRGRNLLRIQGDLLGAHALGIRNLFVVMGDPTRIGDYPEAMDNYDIVPSGLIQLTRQKMNVGVDQAGNSIGLPTHFTVGCALNMGANDIDKEIGTLRKKIEAGASFALGQPMFEPAKVETFLRRYEELEGQPLKLPVLMGVMPLYSIRHATFLDNEVPGINIPKAHLERIETAGENSAQEGVTIAKELLNDMKGMIQGAYIIPAFGKHDLVAQIIESVVG